MRNTNLITFKATASIGLNKGRRVQTEGKILKMPVIWCRGSRRWGGASVKPTNSEAVSKEQAGRWQQNSLAGSPNIGNNWQQGWQQCCSFTCRGHSHCAIKSKMQSKNTAQQYIWTSEQLVQSKQSSNKYTVFCGFYWTTPKNLGEEGLGCNSWSCCFSVNKL